MSTNVASLRTLTLTPRHPGESRDPATLPWRHDQRHWIPAFAGTTKWVEPRHFQLRHSGEGRNPAFVPTVKTWIPAFAGMTERSGDAQ